MRDAGLTEQDTFSPANQRAMAIALMIGTKQPALSAYLNGRSDNLDAAHQAIANEWASIQGPSGSGSYDGDAAGNFAHTDGEKIRQLLIQMRAEMLGE
jgi:DNA transposition AAA+ family ATPase